MSLLIRSYHRLFSDLERDVQSKVSRRALQPLVDEINDVYNIIHRILFERMESTQNLSVFRATRLYFNSIDHPSRAQELLAMTENRAVGAPLPTVISEGHVDAGLSCPICMENFQVGSEVSKMPCHECHLFHSHCIKSWLERNSTCPTCRTEVESRNSSSQSLERQDERNSRSPPADNSNRR